MHEANRDLLQVLLRPRGPLVYWGLPLSTFHSLLTFKKCLRSRVLVALNQKNRKKYLSASSWKQKSACYLYLFSGPADLRSVNGPQSRLHVCPRCSSWLWAHLRPRASCLLLFSLFGLACGSSMTICGILIFLSYKVTFTKERHIQINL